MAAPDHEQGISVAGDRPHFLDREYTAARPTLGCPLERGTVEISTVTEIASQPANVRTVPRGRSVTHRDVPPASAGARIEGGS